MRILHSPAHLFLAAAAIMIASTPQAEAVTLGVHIFSAYQISTTDGVSFGVAASGYTNYNRLTVGGTYELRCANPDMLPMTGQRTLSVSNLTGGISQSTTIPEVVPARVNMPGFDLLNRGDTVYCTFAWTARAAEGGYSVGANGITFPLGNTEETRGSTETFTMRKPGTADPNGTTPCIP